MEKQRGSNTWCYIGGKGDTPERQKKRRTRRTAPGVSFGGCGLGESGKKQAPKRVIFAAGKIKKDEMKIVTPKNFRGGGK